MKIIYFRRIRTVLLGLPLYLFIGINIIFAFPTDDTLIISGSDIKWFGLEPGISYTCIADTSGIGTNISPAGHPCEWVYLEPGVIDISGSPNRQVQAWFILPTKLYGDNGGTITPSYSDSSAALIDLRTGRPTNWFNPTLPVTITLDTTGVARIWLVANVAVENTVWSARYSADGIISAKYNDSLSDPIQFYFGFTADIDLEGGPSPSLYIEPENPIVWSGLRPGIQYKCSTDTVDNIIPRDSITLEIMKLVVLEVAGCATYEHLFNFTLMPETLKSKNGPGFITLSYDSTSITVRDPVTNAILPHHWYHFPDSLIAPLKEDGALQIYFTGNPTVSPDVTEGDTLGGYGIILGERIPVESSLQSFMKPLQIQVDFELRAIIRKSTDGIKDDKDRILPEYFHLFQNHPNPFNPVTRIRYQVPVQSEISLKIYNVLGVGVATLADGTVNAGTHEAEWNASGFPSGVYFYRLQAGNFSDIKKLLLIR
jgi:hypothetical protein